ncbi:hypothetical protein DSM112329_03091 [Paraconexibacter sp. AEG42_29]|uniref:Prepilin-type N-terminal cleavage/methylation domain-containing protein n=1 Tax=Paraconexibacter sp. AEG42_29 TaxID=2997339 RepID=A0AAU7AX63_9ACTN
MKDNGHPTRTDAGFTIVEVMVAMMILLVGVLAMLNFTLSGASSTGKTAAREQGTNVARELIERSRQVPYANVTATTAPAQLRATLPDAGALSGSSFAVTRRGTTYTVSIAACSIDDPSDGVGVGDATYCANPNGSAGPGSAATSTAVGLNVLGISVAAGGSLLSTVCNALGTNSTILNAVTAAVSAIAPVSACTSTSGTAAFDSRPDDLRLVQVTVNWTKGTAQTLRQTTLLTNPLPNDCPMALAQVTTATPLPSGCPTPTS